MRSLIYAIALLSTFSAIACGPPYNPEGEFYNLLNQEITLNKEFFPFLRSDYGFYGDNYYYDEYEVKKSENLNLWQTEILPKVSKIEVEQLLFSHSKHTFDSIVKVNGLERTSDVVTYLKYIHQLKTRTDSHIRHSWDYEVILGKYKPNASVTIEDTKERFTATKNLQIKQRYLYQLIRLYHYNGFYSDAIDVFEKYEDEFDKNEIYYYTLDQVGGCYYSLEDYKQAAVNFISVFKNSKDKKVSSFNSYKFTMSRLGGHTELKVPKELYTTYKLLTALRFPNLTF